VITDILFLCIQLFRGKEVCLLKDHRILPLILCSVQRDLLFCRNRTQNVDFPYHVGPSIIHLNGCYNLTSVLKAQVKMTIVLCNWLIYTRTGRTFCYLYFVSWSMIFHKSYPQDLWLLIHRRPRPFSVFSFYLCVLSSEAARLNTRL